jgi:hypothetical protein
VTRPIPGGEAHGWLTVPQILEDLQVTAEEWHAWRAAGETPAHAAMPDDTLRVNAAEYNLWLEDRVTDLAEALSHQADASAVAQPDAPRTARAAGTRHLAIVPPARKED